MSQLFKRSDAIIAMTPESVAELDSIGYPAARVLKVTERNPACFPRTSQELRSSEAVNVVFVGRLSPEKGLSDLLHAWVSVKARATLQSG